MLTKCSIPHLHVVPARGMIPSESRRNEDYLGENFNDYGLSVSDDDDMRLHGAGRGMQCIDRV